MIFAFLLSNSDAGLIGPIVITRRGMSRSDEDLKPKDVDREVFSLFQIFDENKSPLFGKTIDKFIPGVDLTKLMPSGASPLDSMGGMAMDAGMDTGDEMNSNSAADGGVEMGATDTGIHNMESGQDFTSEYTMDEAVGGGSSGARRRRRQPHGARDKRQNMDMATYCTPSSFGTESAAKYCAAVKGLTVDTAHVMAGVWWPGVMGETAPLSDESAAGGDGVSNVAGDNCAASMYATEAEASACAEALGLTPNTAHTMGAMWMPGLESEGAVSLMESLMSNDDDSPMFLHAHDMRPLDRLQTAFYESNRMHSINGYMYCNQPALDLRRGQRVRWCVI
jgi:hypothetical protein